LNTTKWKEETSLDLQSGYRKDSKRGPAATFLFDVSVSQETIEEKQHCLRFPTWDRERHKMIFSMENGYAKKTRGSQMSMPRTFLSLGRLKFGTAMLGLKGKTIPNYWSSSLLAKETYL